MYQKGDYINYSGQGICQVTDIRSMDFRTGAGARNYYILSPIDQEGTVFYLPEEGSDTRSRKLLTREEIDGILAGIRNAQMPWIGSSAESTFRRSSPAGTPESWCSLPPACTASRWKRRCPWPTGRPCTGWRA